MVAGALAPKHAAAAAALAALLLVAATSSQEALYSFSLHHHDHHRHHHHHQQQQQRVAAHHARRLTLHHTTNHTLLAELLGSLPARPFTGAFQRAAPSAPGNSSSSDGAGDGSAQPPRQPGGGVLCAPIPVFISYPPKSGLCNMALSAVNAWAIAVALGADVLLARAQRREAFAGPQPKFSKVPFGSLFNARATEQMLAELGVRAAARYPPGGGSENIVVDAKFRYDYQKIGRNGTAVKGKPMFDLERLVPLLKKRVTRAAARNQLAQGRRGVKVRCDEPPTVHLHIDHTYKIIRTSRLPLAAHLAHRLRFSDAVEQRAALIAAAMQEQGYGAYNGLHLRLEADFARLADLAYGNSSAMVAAYADAARLMGWGRSGRAATRRAGTHAPSSSPTPRLSPTPSPPLPLPVYVASGLFTYPEGRQEYEQAVKQLVPYASVFLHKEHFEERLNASMAGALPALDSEQAAAVDLLLLVRAHQFVGAFGTSFSWFVAQRRLMAGRLRRDAMLAGEWPSGDGVEELYKRAWSYSEACPVRRCADWWYGRKARERAKAGGEGGTAGKEERKRRKQAVGGVA